MDALPVAATPFAPEPEVCARAPTASAFLTLLPHQTYSQPKPLPGKEEAKGIKESVEILI